MKDFTEICLFTMRVKIFTLSGSPCGVVIVDIWTLKQSQTLEKRWKCQRIGYVLFNEIKRMNFITNGNLIYIVTTVAGIS